MKKIASVIRVIIVGVIVAVALLVTPFISQYTNTQSYAMYRYDGDSAPCYVYKLIFKPLKYGIGALTYAKIPCYLAR